MDFPSKSELLACKFGSCAEIANHLGATSLRHLSVEGLLGAVRDDICAPDSVAPAASASDTKPPFCGACFTGVYPVAGDW